MFGPWEIFQLLIGTMRSVESNSYGSGVSAGDGFDQIETGTLPSSGASTRPKGQTVIEKQVRFEGYVYTRFKLY